MTSSDKSHPPIEKQHQHSLTAIGISAKIPKMEQRREHLRGQGSDEAPDTLVLTPRTKRVITIAIAEADRLGQRHIGIQHLLLGLLREGAGVAFAVLTARGVTVDEIRA